MAVANTIVMMDTPINSLALTKLLTLVSPTLPIGGFTYSTGLEYAAHIQEVTDYDSTYAWVYSQLCNALSYNDLVVLRLAIEALDAKDTAELSVLDELLLASRETSEFYAEEIQKGKALQKIMQHHVPVLPEYQSFVVNFAILGHTWQIPVQSLLVGYVWNYIENQVTNATKIIPLGQTTGQKLLYALTETTDEILQLASTHTKENIGHSQMFLSIVSALHETQYTRIYRS